MNSYRDQFKAARQRAISFVQVDEPFTEGTQLLTQTQGETLQEIVVDELGAAGVLRPEDVAFRCGQVSSTMVRHVEEVTGQSAHLTLGTVSKSADFFWDFDQNDVAGSISRGHFHVWLTTPALEIVDFTFLISQAVQQGKNPSLANPIAGLPHKFGKYSWHPRVAGNAAVRCLLRISL